MNVMDKIKMFLFGWYYERQEIKHELQCFESWLASENVPSQDKMTALESLDAWWAENEAQRLQENTKANQA